jgi:hypothetical protein
MTSLVLEAAMMTNLSSHRINLNAKFSIGSMNDESYKKRALNHFYILQHGLFQRIIFTFYRTLLLLKFELFVYVN